MTITREMIDEAAKHYCAKSNGKEVDRGCGDCQRQAEFALEIAAPVIERLRAALENAEQHLDLYINGAASIEDGTHTLAHVRAALGHQQRPETK